MARQEGCPQRDMKERRAAGKQKKRPEPLSGSDLYVFAMLVSSAFKIVLRIMHIVMLDYLDQAFKQP